MADPDPDHDPDWKSPEYRDRRFTWEKGDIVFLKKGTGGPLMTPEQLEEAIAHHEPAKQARLEEIRQFNEANRDVDYPPDEDIETPPAKP